MSATAADGRFLLLFPRWGTRDGGWLRLDGAKVAARGTTLDAIAPPPAPDSERVVLVAPGEAVSLHWIELPDLAPEQARAAARIVATDVVAEPIDRVHVAVSGAALPLRPMALVAAATLAGWLEEAQALALDPDHVVPEPLLIPPPEDDAEGERHWLREDGLIVARGIASGHVATPAVAALVAEGAPVAIDDVAFEAGLAAALAAMPLDLRQGRFARRRQWKLDAALARRLGRLIAAILAVTLLVQLTLIVRYRMEARRQIAIADAAAATALPRDTRITDAGRQLRERMARLRGGGLGFSATAALLFGAVRDTAGAELGAMRFAGDGGLTATVTAPGAAEIDALVQRLQAQGLVATPGEQRMGGGRMVVELVVRAP